MGEDTDQQAADWLARLRTRSVGNDELRRFAEWRRVPGNADAYERVERLWREAEPLAADPDVHVAVQAALAAPRRGRAIAMGAVALAASVLVVLAFVAVRGPGDGTTYRAAAGERSAARLADGSSVAVDVDSELRVRFETTSRRLTLVRGQALFAVAHDAERPFVVATPSGVTVTAIGTRFDVESLADGSVRVALLEGRVAVARRDARLGTLEPGQTLLVPASGAPSLRREGADEAADWAAGRLVLRGAALRDAVAEMNRYAREPIAIAASGAAGQMVSGEFSLDDPDGFVRAVNALLGPGTVERRHGG